MKQDGKIHLVRLREYGDLSYSYLDYCTERRGPKLDPCGDPAGRVFWALYTGDPSQDFDEDLLVTNQEYRELVPGSRPGRAWDDDGPACWKRKRDAERGVNKANKSITSKLVEQ